MISGTHCTKAHQLATQFFLEDNISTLIVKSHLYEKTLMMDERLGSFSELKKRSFSNDLKSLEQS